MNKKSKGLYPVILGMDPPNKEAIFVRGKHGLDVMICYANFPEGIKRGFIKDNSIYEITGIAAWLRFVNAETMREFGSNLIDAADELEKIGGKKDRKDG